MKESILMEITFQSCENRICIVSCKINIPQVRDAHINSLVQCKFHCKSIILNITVLKVSTSNSFSIRVNLHRMVDFKKAKVSSLHHQLLLHKRTHIFQGILKQRCNLSTFQEFLKLLMTQKTQTIKYFIRSHKLHENKHNFIIIPHINFKYLFKYFQNIRRSLCLLP